MAVLALAVADRGYVIDSGQIVREDSAANLVSDPEVEAAYLGRVEAAQ
jgi:branched-chain amino acid transport system permease protein